jgi:glycosyltransferase involved in cell wall biosynthesis
LQKVSLILPTRGRRDWAKLALDCFVSQTWENKELVILDDMADPSFEDGFQFPEGTVYAMHGKEFHAIGKKRNACCNLATGEFIGHLDSDDWSSPTRIEEQLDLLVQSERAVCGFDSILFYQASTQRVGKYNPRRNYALGSSLLYRKSWWEKHKFPEKNIGEDNAFVSLASKKSALITMDGSRLLVARVHDNNTSKKRMENYKAMTLADLPEGFPR